uniref:Uncharacterized protein n=1 Tax=viral metagenome TaxID=1070528 RepID=A0A6H1ZCQ9_9ZZZZ
MNLTQKYVERKLLLENLLKRIIPTRGREGVYSLKGIITLEERNAIVVGLSEIKTRIASLRLQ